MIYQFGPFELDLATVELRASGNACRLEPQVFALLSLLIENRDRVVSTLPFAVQKLIELGRALVSDPALLLLDEPTAGADPQDSSRLAELIRGARDRSGLSVLVVEHDMSFVMGLCDRLYVLDFGRRIAVGTPSAVRGDPAVIEAYLGEPDAAVLDA